MGKENLPLLMILAAFSLVIAARNRWIITRQPYTKQDAYFDALLGGLALYAMVVSLSERNAISGLIYLFIAGLYLESAYEVWNANRR